MIYVLVVIIFDYFLTGRAQFIGIRDLQIDLMKVYFHVIGCSYVDHQYF